MKRDKIITSFVYPPIPIRTHDWCAYRENDVEDASKYGWGSSKLEAVTALFERENEEDFLCVR